MKYILTAAWSLVCIIVLFYGHTHYQERIEAKSAKASVSANAVKEVNNYDSYLLLANNWPDSAKQQLQAALEAKTPFHILFAGSTALGEPAQNLITASLAEAYGEHVTTSVHTYDVTSADFVANQHVLEVAAQNAQLIIFEPFLLKDNGEIAIEDTLANITTIMETIKNLKPDTTFILQPSYPIYKAKIYPLQVEALKAYTAENQIAYLDHWAAWPDYNSEDLIHYLEADQSAPNEIGYEVWGQSIVDYLIHN
ncbi:SGNH/GDSL hydrolase family protein [Bacillus sp. MRMR6]|uniref:SGNH/GDSL hydrolase family protein n=1 Tax=Bacillus sp. MRMR6 TaxID=1928617 RepID=UPI000950D0D7|nr:SGNH/GDSL hydrolase family protein [Bacillus sp. MRMR6]OLS41109.1 hypothetical protein BTR25_04380 [Bacillus sp. MRMR6]